jgi:glycosyltransferase
MSLKVSIITPVYNNRNTLEDCLRTVLSQSYRDVEYIVVDGGSNDGTLDILRTYDGRISKWISEPDGGIYDAMNKGIRLSSGDVIGFLQSDDVYAHERVVENVVEAFRRFEVDSVYGDLQYVDKRDLNKVVRKWRASIYREGRFKSGWMPPHPTFFVKKEIYHEYGKFNTDFRIAADYELMLRFLELHRISTYYIPDVLVKMRSGGTSNKSLRNILIKSSEDYKAWKVNDLKGGLWPICFTIFLKNVSKIPQFLKI